MSTKKDKFSLKDKNYMRLALNLARARKGLTGDNPSVGCVIVKKDKVISVGQTGLKGRPHAEANAISNTHESLKGAKMYITLEPCNHRGITPPCTKTIINSGINNVYYPINGFMSWHNNWNAPGYNILLSHTKNGGGFFKYRDPKTHEVIEMLDTPGWSCKVGYYGRGREPDKVYYHTAGTHEPRLTLGFVIPNIDMWRCMIEDISGKDASHLS